MEGKTVKHKGKKISVGLIEHHGAGSFIYLPALYAYKPVFYHVYPDYAVPSRNGVEVKDKLAKIFIPSALRHQIPVKATKDKPYSIDKNLWGISIDCGPLEDPWEEPPEDAFEWTQSPKGLRRSQSI